MGKQWFLEADLLPHGSLWFTVSPNVFVPHDIVVVRGLDGEQISLFLVGIALCQMVSNFVWDIFRR